MNKIIAEIEATSLLRRADLKRKAEEVLAQPAVSNRWVMSVLCATAAGVGSYLLEGSTLSHEAKALVVGLIAGVVGLAIENWIIKRRLEAVIQLHLLQQIESKD